MKSPSSALLKRRQKVIEYLQRADVYTTPLRFDADTPTLQVMVESGEDLKGIVLEVFRLTEMYTSLCGNLRETPKGRYRSAIDIWRHLLPYFPDISIFTVMETIHKLRYVLYGHYCSVVRRAVFCRAETRSWVIPLEERSFRAVELKMMFSSWRNIAFGYDPKKEIAEKGGTA